MRAELVRLGLHQVDIKIVDGDQMHVLQWRRNLLWDEILVDGKRQGHSGSLFSREKVYGLKFSGGANGGPGDKFMFLIDPSTEQGNWGNRQQRVSGVRLEGRDGPIVSYGTLDPKSMEKPATFADWMKKTMGMDWG